MPLPVRVGCLGGGRLHCPAPSARPDPPETSSPPLQAPGPVSRCPGLESLLLLLLLLGGPCSNCGDGLTEAEKEELRSNGGRR
jgi:hypothetical protein